MACEENLGLGRAAFTAITRHHSPKTKDCNPYRIGSGAVKVAEAIIWDSVGIANTAIEDATNRQHQFGSNLVGFDRQHFKEVILYDLLVRVLRLTDQRSLQK